MSDPMNLMDLATLGGIDRIRAVGGAFAITSAILGIASMFLTDGAAWIALALSLLTSLIYSHTINTAHKMETESIIQLMQIAIAHGMIGRNTE